MHWATAIQPTRVLGLTLREPVTLAHVLLLEEIGSPIPWGRDATAGDVAVAAFVCAWPADKSRKLVGSALFPLAMAMLALVNRRRNKLEEGRRFIQWFSDQCKTPPQFTQDGARECAAPWWLNRIAFATGECGLSLSETLNSPCRLISLIVSARAESKGVVEFETARQTEFFENVKRWTAEMSN